MLKMLDLKNCEYGFREMRDYESGVLKDYKKLLREEAKLKN